MISKEDVEELAGLARLRLGAAEAERLRGDLARILAYVEQLQGLDTTGVEPMTHAVPLDCPLREDAAAPSFSADEALAGAPARTEDYFVVPRVVEK
jgi:aspartyl-tRNA(Asn)/glutamyl-tRNA(Gln) amidotransferase subunit C